MQSGPRILSLATEVPKGRWTQDQILEVLGEHFPLYRDRRVQRIVRASGIDTRHLALEESEFDPEPSADDLHTHYERHAPALAEKAARRALADAELEASDVDCIVATTCTGYLCPGLSARLGASLGLRRDIQRADLVGMGCAGAMPTLQRAHDFVRAYPERKVLAVTVEVSSACWYVDDTLETVVGNTICADGAAAAIVGHPDPSTEPGRLAPRIDAFSTLMEPAFLDSVGLEFKGGKQRIVLSKDLRHAAGPLVKKAVDQLLLDHELDFADVDHWIVHSGGKRVLDSIDRSLGFTENELDASRFVLRNYGNMSSPTLLFVLQQTLAKARPGDLGVLVALGPGLAAETGIVRF